MNAIFTIGHSNHPIERFVALLQQHAIDAVADVRSQPYSRFNPQFGRERLQRSLQENDIEYLFLGAELGARSEDESCYEEGRVSYAKLAATPPFQHGIEQVLITAQTRRVALMCAEKEPLECHRTILVARELARHGREVLHILANGALETHEQAMARLRTQLKLPQDDLFRDEAEWLDAAYAAQARNIAYVKPADKR